MFSSGFSEASSDQGQQSGVDTDDGASDDTYLGRQFEDSDDEDDEFMTRAIDEPSFDGTAELQIEEDAGPSVPVIGTNHTESSALLAEDDTKESSGEDAQIRDVRPKLSHPSSPRSQDVALNKSESDWTKISALPEAKDVAGPKKMRVVIRDVAYATYKAVLYYVSAVPGIILNNHDLRITDLYRCHHLCTDIVDIQLYGS